MTFIDNASKWYLMHSQRALLAIGALQTTIVSLPADIQAMPLVGHYTLLQVLTACTIATTVLGFIGRLLVQPAVTDPATPGA